MLYYLEKHMHEVFPLKLFSIFNLHWLQYVFYNCHTQRGNKVKATPCPLLMVYI